MVAVTKGSPKAIASPLGIRTFIATDRPLVGEADFRGIAWSGSAMIISGPRSNGSGRKMNSTQFVAVGVTKIGQFDGAHRGSFSRSGRSFDRCPASSNGGIVKLLYLFGRVAGKGDGATVGDGRRFVVDRLADDEVGSVAVIVDQTCMAAVGNIPRPFPCTQGAEHRVVEALGPFNVIRSDHGVKKHRHSPEG